MYELNVIKRNDYPDPEPDLHKIQFGGLTTLHPFVKFHRNLLITYTWYTLQVVT